MKKTGYDAYPIISKATILKPRLGLKGLHQKCIINKVLALAHICGIEQHKASHPIAL